MPNFLVFNLLYYTLSNVLKLTEILIRFTAESNFEGPLVLSNETRYDQINYIFEFLLKRPFIWYIIWYVSCKLKIQLLF